MSSTYITALKTCDTKELTKLIPERYTVIQLHALILEKNNIRRYNCP